MKSPNIMLNTLDKDSKEVIIKIADFGIVKLSIFSCYYYYYLILLGTSRKIRTMIRGKFVENPLWLAPEVIMNKVWSNNNNVLILIVKVIIIVIIIIIIIIIIIR
jgi:serine/threonine protein kinase